LSRKTTQNDVDKAGSVVLVIQGTLVNDDLGQLVGPTLTALANEDLTVIASTGGPPVESIPAALPPNAKAAAFLPLDRLLPKVSVMVTNGGYGAVNYALSLGVPSLPGIARKNRKLPRGSRGRAPASISAPAGHQPRRFARRSAPYSPSRNIASAPRRCAPHLPATTLLTRLRNWSKTLRPAGRRRTLTEPDWFRLAERLIAKGKAVFEDSTVHESEAGTADPKVVALALLARTIGKFEAAVLLLNNGYLDAGIDVAGRPDRGDDDMQDFSSSDPGAFHLVPRIEGGSFRCQFFSARLCRAARRRHGTGRLGSACGAKRTFTKTSASVKCQNRKSESLDPCRAALIPRPW
jgi:hypothetical protein